MDNVLSAPVLLPPQNNQISLLEAFATPVENQLGLYQVPDSDTLFKCWIATVKVFGSFWKYLDQICLTANQVSEHRMTREAYRCYTSWVIMTYFAARPYLEKPQQYMNSMLL